MKTLIKQTTICILFSLSQLLAQDYNIQIDSIFQAYNSDSTPGCAIAVVKDGKIVYKKGYGVADFEHNIPITPQSVFYIGSVSKQFVAACTALLEEEGKLSFDDEIHEYIPELPSYPYPVTIRQLIHHTSGLRDYLDLGFLGEIDWYDYVSKQEIINLIARQEKLNFKPGDQHSYCNTGYFLLALVVERVSGLAFKDYAKKYIFDPLKMTSSHFHDDPFHIIPNRAWSYQENENGGYKFIVWRFSAVGSGGLYSTVEDLYKWDQNFYHNILGKGRKAFIDTLEKPGRLNDGSAAGNYAFAMVNETYNGLKIINHTGSMGGYRAYYARFPEENFSVITLGNLSSFNAKAMSRKVADLFLAARMTFAKNEKDIRETDNSYKDYQLTAPEEYKGNFYTSELPANYEIKIKNDDLFVSAQSEFVDNKILVPTDKDRFLIDNWLEFVFIRNQSGKVSGFVLNMKGGIQDIVFVKK
ncbi:MAG: beta-lactamase family protein [Calditrichaeota bacterium]|nr:beta-lactamase family protein [Calditrichota bacterium]